MNVNNKYESQNPLCIIKYTWFTIIHVLICERDLALVICKEKSEVSINLLHLFFVTMEFGIFFLNLFIKISFFLRTHTNKGIYSKYNTFLPFVLLSNSKFHITWIQNSSEQCLYKFMCLLLKTLHNLNKLTSQNLTDSTKIKFS